MAAPAPINKAPATSAMLICWADATRSFAALPAAAESRSFSSTQRLRASMAAAKLGRSTFLSSSMASFSRWSRERARAFCMPLT